MAIFLVFGMLLAGTWKFGITGSLPGAERGILGGPEAQAAIVSDSFSSPAPAGIAALTESGPTDGDLLAYGAVAYGEADVLDEPGSPLVSPFSRDNLSIYVVRKGDTLSGVASYFGVSLDTIVNANPSVKRGFIKPGDQLNILPTSGIVYKTREGDTLESVSDYFNIPQENLVQFNKSINFNVLGAGISLVIPGARSASLAPSHSNSLSNFNSNFQKPADGFNWGILHHYNAVDIANSCGTPVVASAEGLVVPDDNFGDGKTGWEGGYGKFVLIEHPFGDGVRTRYAHLEKILVDIGDYVQQGQEIGLMGETGDATGCHVHFEVYGAENPFAR